MAKTARKEITSPVEATGALVKLVDEIAEGHAPIIVARDGEPKAALVSMDDYERLKGQVQPNKDKWSWDEWFAKSQEFQEQMLESRGNQPIDQEIIDRALRESREDLEERDSYNAGLGR